jgi:hypothetical protein
MFAIAALLFVGFQYLVCHRFGRVALAALTAAPLGLICLLIWHLISEANSIHPCEACRLRGVTCGGCEMGALLTAYAVVGLIVLGTLYLVSGLLIGWLTGAKRQ